MKRTPMGTAVARHFVATRLVQRWHFPSVPVSFTSTRATDVVVVTRRVQGDYTRRVMYIVHGERSQNARTLKRFACVSKRHFVVQAMTFLKKKH